MLDVNDIAEVTATIVADAIERATAPLVLRIAELEAREIPQVIHGENGKDADPETMKAMIAEEVGRAVAALPVPQDGKSVELCDLNPMVAEAVAAAVALIPAPENGKDADPDIIKSIVGEMAPELLSPIVTDTVSKMIAALPHPEKGEKGDDGESVSLEAVAEMIASEVSKAVLAIPAPKDGEDGSDGVGLAGALIDRDGSLVLTLTNGDTKNLGLVVGRDGEDGKTPPPFTLDDFDIVPLDDGRSIEMSFTHGNEKHTFELCFAVPLDRGVFKEGVAYSAGDCVTWGGSLWIAQRNTSSKPDSPESGFRLAVKKGRDGK